MARSTDELVDLLHLENLDPGLYRGDQPRSMLQRTFGGLVLAQALAAANGTVTDQWAVHSLHAYFLRPGNLDHPLIYDVQVLRDGHTFSTRRVDVRQMGRVICQVSASFHVSEDGLDHQDRMPTGVPDPDDCPNFHDVMRRTFGRRQEQWREWDALDVRLAGSSKPGEVPDGEIASVSHGAHMRLWIRTAGPLPDPVTPDARRLHESVLAYLSDLSLLSVSTVPHEVEFGAPNLLAASIDHAMWFHRRFRADHWLLYDEMSPSASHALGFSQGRLFQDGALVASTAQEGLIRVLGR